MAATVLLQAVQPLTDDDVNKYNITRCTSQQHATWLEGSSCPQHEACDDSDKLQTAMQNHVSANWQSTNLPASLEALNLTASAEKDSAACSHHTDLCHQDVCAVQPSCCSSSHSQSSTHYPSITIPQSQAEPLLVSASRVQACGLVPVICLMHETGRSRKAAN